MELAGRATASLAATGKNFYYAGEGSDFGTLWMHQHTHITLVVQAGAAVRHYGRASA